MVQVPGPMVFAGRSLYGSVFVFLRPLAIGGIVGFTARHCVTSEATIWQECESKGASALQHSTSPSRRPQATSSKCLSTPFLHS